MDPVYLERIIQLSVLKETCDKLYVQFLFETPLREAGEYLLYAIGRIKRKF